MLKSQHTNLQHRGLRPVSELGAGRNHGERLRYMAGCRCADCRRANTEYEKVRAAARKAGDWNGIVAATRAHRHLVRLSAAGIGKRQVADASGVALSIVAGLMSGKRKNLRAMTERAILAVTQKAAADGALIDAAPTWKLLDDLLATGYAKANLARELGMKTPAIQIKRTQCTVRTAYEVEQLHARLRRVPDKESLSLLAELREEGYRHDRLIVMLRKRALDDGRMEPDFAGHHGFIDAYAADLVRRLHTELTEVPA